MKCKICGHRANSLQAMNKHYSKDHPGRKRKRKAKVQAEAQTSESFAPPRASGARFCKWCGGRVD